MQVDQAPHVQVDIIHFDGVCDLLLVKLGPSGEDIDVLIVKDAACSGIASHVQIRYPAPGVVLDVVLLASGIKGLCVVASNHKNETSLRIECGEVTASEEQGTSINEHLFLINILHHPVAAHVILVTAANAEDATFISHYSSAKLRDVEVILQGDLMRDHLIDIEEVNVLRAPFKVVHEFA